MARTERVLISSYWYDVSYDADNRITSIRYVAD